MVKVAAAAVTAALCGSVVRRGAPELAALLVLAAGGYILWQALSALEEVTALMGELVRLSGLEQDTVEPVFKTVVISILTRLTAEVCRSAGEGGTAAFVEAAGTVLALAAALPLVRGMLTLTEGLMG